MARTKPRPQELNGRPRQRLVREVRAQGRANATPCYLCGLPIDYDADPQLDPLGMVVDEITARALIPQAQRKAHALDPAETAPTHRVCNASKGKRPPTAEVRARCRELAAAAWSARTRRAEQGPRTTRTW